MTSAPTASFWDCSELVACSYILGIPHPPGTPLFVILGRIFALLPLAREPAARIGMLTSVFGAAGCALLYLVIVKLTGPTGQGLGPGRPQDTAENNRQVEERVEPGRAFSLLPHIAGIAGALSLAFAYSYWNNSVETEVYGPVTAVTLLVLLLALNWREKVENGSGDNRIVPVSIFLIMLSAGIHFTPMLAVFALLVFWLIIERRSVLDLRLIEFVGGYLIILTIVSMAGGVVLRSLVGLLLLGLLGLAVWVMERSSRAVTIVYGLMALAGMLVAVYVAGFDRQTGKNMIVDDVVLFMASPSSALIDRWFAGKGLLIAFLVVYLGYLYWLKRRNKLDAGYAGLGLFLIMLAGTVQYFLLARARLHPGINEVDPQGWSDFISVLKREQYDPMKLLPRKTMFASESDYVQDTNRALGLAAGYFEQVKFYLRYFFWQWAGPQNLDVLAYSRNWFFPFLQLNPVPALVGLVPPALGVWGIIDRFRNDRKAMVLVGLAFLTASLGLLTYLNLKLSPSDPRHLLSGAGGMHFVEVRERDYFFAFSFIFYAVFIGVGVHAMLERSRIWLARSRAGLRAVAAGTMLLFILPFFFNLKAVNRRGDWIPAEYGYDMLASCEDGSVLFTNGDNDTFPLWFVQQVPTRPAGYQDGFRRPVPPRRGVMVANLSLLNTTWYVKQMIEWGAPLSFSAARFDSLPDESYHSPQGGSFLLKDMVIRDLIATSSGMQLKWGNEFIRVTDPGTGRPVGIPAFYDEYRPARALYDTLTRAVQATTPDAAAQLLAVSERFLDVLEENHFSVAARELRQRLPRYRAMAAARARPDSAVSEKLSFADWLRRGDYGMSSAEFIKYVVSNVPEHLPILFATTVQDEYMDDLRKGDSLYVEIEGLVQRVVSRAGPVPAQFRALDPVQTRRLLESVYVTTSMSDRAVEKDQNTRGMFGNFVLAGIKLADDFYAESLQFGRARSLIRHTLQLDIDVGHRIPLWEALFRYSYLDRQYDTAQMFLDSLRRNIDDPGTIQHLRFLQAFVRQLAGDFDAANGIVAAVASGVPRKAVSVVFDSLYAGYARTLGDEPARRALDRWRRQDPADSMPIWIGMSLDEVARRTSRSGPGTIGGTARRR